MADTRQVVTLPRNADEFRALVVALGGHLDDDELVETTLIERGDAVYYDDDGQLVARVTWRELLARFDRFKLDESHGGEPEREPCHQCHGLGCVSCGGEGFAV